MKKYIQNGIIVTDGKILKNTDIEIENGKITALVKHEKQQNSINLDGKYISAGWIDIHCHGGGGAEFIDGTVDAVKTACGIHSRHGTRIIFPTISATDIKTMMASLKAVESAMRDVAPMIGGVHLEGPYLAKEMCGGQAAGVIREPDEKEYIPILERFGKIIARWSYAPEHDKDNRFLKSLTNYGVVPATAHSSAEYADIVRALDDGNRLVTHLYSCTSTVTRKNGFRHMGIVESAFLLDELFAEVIGDGAHLPLELLKTVIKIKSIDKTVLVTDALRPAGVAHEGDVYENCPVPFVIEDGVAKLLDRSAFAGSIATTDVLVKTAISAGIPLEDTVKMITETPATVMGLKHNGRIAPGFDALFTVFDENINVFEMN